MYSSPSSQRVPPPPPHPQHLASPDMLSQPVASECSIPPTVLSHTDGTQQAHPVAQGDQVVQGEHFMDWDHADQQQATATATATATHHHVQVQVDDDTILQSSEPWLLAPDLHPLLQCSSSWKELYELALMHKFCGRDDEPMQAWIDEDKLRKMGVTEKLVGLAWKWWNEKIEREEAGREAGFLTGVGTGNDCGPAPAPDIKPQVSPPVKASMSSRGVSTTEIIEILDSDDETEAQESSNAIYRRPWTSAEKFTLINHLITVGNTTADWSTIHRDINALCVGNMNHKKPSRVKQAFRETHLRDKFLRSNNNGTLDSKFKYIPPNLDAKYSVSPDAWSSNQIKTLWKGVMAAGARNANWKVLENEVNRVGQGRAEGACKKVWNEVLSKDFGFNGRSRA